MAEIKKSKNTVKKDDSVVTVPNNRKNIEIKVRGRTFEGKVIRKLPGRVTIEFDRMLKVPKYERYEKRRTKLHARLPESMSNDVEVGDLIQVGETRPISKMIHFIVTKKIRSAKE